MVNDLSTWSVTLMLNENIIFANADKLLTIKRGSYDFYLGATVMEFTVYSITLYYVKF